MEIIDISKFYRFQSIPNPLVLASDMINFHNRANHKENKFTQIENLDLNEEFFSTVKEPEFDNILKDYSQQTTEFAKNNENYKTRKQRILKQLNKVKLYLIVREANKNDENLILLPLNNLENLSDKAVSKLYLHRDGLFEINANRSLYFSNKLPGDRRFYMIDDLLTTQGAFDSELDVKVKNIKFETEDEILNRKGLKGKLLGDDPKYYSLPDYENNEYLPNIDPDPQVWREEDRDSIWIQKYGIPKQDYEYDEAEIDNILFSNPIKYLIGTEKPIFPAFEKLEDAESFLVATFEELLEPFRRKRIAMTRKEFLNLNKKEQYILLLPSSYLLTIEDGEINNPRDLDSLDNVIQYNNPIPPKTKFDKIKHWLAKRRLIKSFTKIEPPYISDNYDQNAYLAASNSLLLNYTTTTKIIEMGLGDFFDIWFHKDDLKKEIFKSPKVLQKKLNSFIKKIQQKEVNGEILFIPDLQQKSIATESNILHKYNNLEQFSSYQKLFQDSRATRKKFRISYEIGKVMSISEVEKFLNKKIEI
uniref:Uncharacterized protein n=1 Tax=Dictyopteris divaricata TaxID=156996 RepID=A0A2I4Q2F5_9PHAE|nr:hypothetical protein [Dictyopteris divaricata]AQZ25014.1 hypothetical protein [Dictyopteris divaricata]